MPRPRTASRTVTIRVPDHEAERLAAYAKETGRTKTDVLRSAIRALPLTAKKLPTRRPKAPSRRTPS